MQQQASCPQRQQWNMVQGCSIFGISNFIFVVSMQKILVLLHDTVQIQNQKMRL
jgi:hypothetical protein